MDQEERKFTNFMFWRVVCFSGGLKAFTGSFEVPQGGQRQSSILQFSITKNGKRNFWSTFFGSRYGFRPVSGSCSGQNNEKTC
jgi:hypothetical protein